MGRYSEPCTGSCWLGTRPVVTSAPQAGNPARCRHTYARRREAHAAAVAPGHSPATARMTA
jgi:hypothetical protein